MAETIRMIAGHSAQCWIVDNDKLPPGARWCNPVVVEQGHAVRFLCNDSTCSAYIVVSVTMLSELIENIPTGGE